MLILLAPCLSLFLTCPCVSEVTISLLVAAFKFELSKDKPHVWNSAGVAYPAAKIGDREPEMFLKVSLASGA